MDDEKKNDPVQKSDASEIPEKPYADSLWLSRDEYTKIRDQKVAADSERPTAFVKIRYVLVMILVIMGLMTVLAFTVDNDSFDLVAAPPVLLFLYGLISIIADAIRRRTGRLTPARPFRNSLMAAALIAGVAYVPVAIVVFIILMATGVVTLHI